MVRIALAEFSAARAPWAIIETIPAIIKPPLTNKRTETRGAYSLREITNAIMDITIAPPPNAPPLIASLKGKNPSLSCEDEAKATSAPYITRRTNDAISRPIAIFKAIRIIVHDRFNKRTLQAIIVSADVKAILYSIIDQVGKEKIRIEVNAEISRSEVWCNTILEGCKLELGPDLNDEILGNFCEALLHFMLTASVLPSQRRVKWKGTSLDIVIPSIKVLSKSPERAIVIQIIRTDAELTKIKQAETVQPRFENIWILSATHLNITRRNYYVGSGKFPYCRMVSDINAFLVRKGVRGLKMLHG